MIKEILILSQLLPQDWPIWKNRKPDVFRGILILSQLLSQDFDQFEISKTQCVSGRCIHFPTDGFLRGLRHVLVMVHLLPDHCHFMGVWRPQNVQLYWTHDRSQNPLVLVALLGRDRSSIHDLCLLVLFHQVHSHHVWQRLQLSSMGWNAWIHD